MTDDAAELRSLRDRLLILEHQDRELWRAHRQLRRRHDEIEERVNSMTEADKIAHAVTSAIRDDRRRRFTLPRRLAGAGAAAILLVPALHDLVLWLSST